MPARLGPIRFFPGSSVWQIPQVFRNSRAPSSSARTPAPRQLSARVRDSASTAAEKNLPISPPNWTATPQRLTVKDVLSCIRTERDVVGWEGARWGMNEREIRAAFSSKLLVPLARKQPDETVLSIPGYVYLGCPFDITFRFAGARGLVRINLTEVGNLSGHRGNGIAGYGAACKLIDRRLEDMFGPG